MALRPIKEKDAVLHLAPGTIVNSLISGTAEIEQSKIANLVSDLAARAENAANETITGSWTFSQTLTVAAVNMSGDLDIGSGKFTVDSATGDTVIAGTLAVTGALNLSGGVAITRAAATDMAFAAKVTGDAANRYFVAADGKITWGSGAGAGDVSLYRSAAATLTTDGTLSVGGDVVIAGDLIVNGNATYVNSTNLQVEDKVVTVNRPQTPGANDPVPVGYTGFSVHRGTSSSVARDHAALVWSEAGAFELAFLSDDGTTLGARQNLGVAALAATNGAFSGTLAATGDFAINTNKFTVAAASGNTLVAGTLNVTGAGAFASTLSATGDFAVNTNKFTVAAATGNTLVAGTFTSTGAASLNSTLGVSGATTLSSTATIAGVLTTQAGIIEKLTVLTAAGNLSLTTAHHVVVVNKTVSEATQITLPATPTAGQVIEVKDGKGDAPDYPITIVAAAGTIDGAANTIIYNANGWRILKYDGTEWRVVGREPKKLYINRIKTSTNGLTSIAKPSGAPPIPDSDETEFLKDGILGFRGANDDFTVDVGGAAITIATSSGNAELTLRYWV